MLVFFPECVFALVLKQKESKCFPPTPQCVRLFHVSVNMLSDDAILEIGKTMIWGGETL